MGRISTLDKLMPPQRKRALAVMSEHGFRNVDAVLEALRAEGINFSRSPLSRIMGQLRNGSGSAITTEHRTVVTAFDHQRGVYQVIAVDLSPSEVHEVLSNAQAERKQPET